MDWVKARAECSLADVFVGLRRDIERDVLTRNGLTVEGIASYKFRIVKAPGDRDDEFSVVREGVDGAMRSIDVTYRPPTIEIGELRATLTLNEEGRCLFVIAGQELESWQVRRRALERLFFQD